jgi:signal transduction histidine kinase/streptogramin lyase
MLRACVVAAPTVALLVLGSTGAIAQTRAAPGIVAVLQHDDVHCAHEDPVGFLWLCTDAGLARFDGEQTVTFGSEAGQLRALLQERDGNIWVAGHNGVFEFVMAPPRGQDPYLRPASPSPPPVSVHAIVRARDGSILCATDRGLMRLVDSTLQPVEIGLPADAAGHDSRAVLEDSERTLWVAAASGLYMRAVDGRTRRFTTSDGLPSDDVRTLAIDAAGRLWAGTPHGLALVYRGAIERREPGAVRVFTEADGLPSRDVRALHLQSGQTLWIGTSDGVVALQGFGEDGLDVAHESRGFAVTAMSSGAAGTLWLVTESGVRARRPSDRPLRAPTVITAIRVDGRPEPIAAGGVRHAVLDLPWSVEFVEVEFASPRAARARTTGPGEEVEYHVRGEPADTLSWQAFPFRPSGRHLVMSSGFLRRNAVFGGLFVPLPGERLRFPARAADDAPVVIRQKWQDAPPTRFDTRRIASPDQTGWLTLPRGTQRRAVIEHPSRTLEPGRHRFVVAATAGRSLDELADVEFVVRAPPWVEWWFAGPTGLALVAAGLLWRRSRRVRHDEIERVRSRIAADLHDSVGASLSRIAILSDVAAQQARAGSASMGAALSAIGENARAVIDEMNDAVWFIDPEAGDVRHLIVRIRTAAASLFETDGVAVRVDAQPEALDVRLSSDERRHIFLILKEALTNVRRHARATAVSVSITRTGAGLRCEIEDDGVGMAPDSMQEPMGHGMSNMRERAGALRGTLSVEAPASGRGTRIVLQTPVR